MRQQPLSGLDEHPRLRRSDPRSKHRRPAGVALIVVLAFVVLISGVVIAFFSHSANELQISSASSNQVKVDLLGQGALDAIIGDLKQEIAAGSVSPAPAPAAGVKLYVPKAPANAVPARDPNLAGITGYENLVKYSSTTPPYAGSTSSQAAGPTSKTPALSGQYVSASRWNNHLLLQRADPSKAAVFTPNALGGSDFSPAWVLVKRTEDLNNPTTAWNSGLTTRGANPAVGRYAYAIYDEGGLLDINAAGYPSVLTATQYKHSIGYADLTQLPGISGLSGTLTPARFLDSLIGFRNYASSAFVPGSASLSPVSGNFPNFTWSAANGNAYNNFLLSATSGFMTAANVPMIINGKAMTDHPFLTRQEFIRTALQYMATTDADRAKLEDALQYLGTFSRSLNQPSVTRDATRPKVVNGSGGNDSYGGDDAINPSFLTIRVTAAFTRNDGTTAAVVGEPLVKKRFPLNNLAWLTFEGPSSQASTATKNALLSAGISQAIINQGDATHIKAYFGLQWNSGSWTYVHGRNGTNGPIMTLQQVATAGTREPDFFELIKAAMSVGSLAKQFYVQDLTRFPGYTPEGYNTQRDASVDAAVMQIGANIIDQFDTDGYPTRITFSDGSLFNGVAQTYRGVEDLPYLYRVREGKIMTEKSVPPQEQLPQVGTPAGFSPGSGVVLQEPEIWNPHAWSASKADVAQRPTNFRVVAISSDPNGVSTSSVQPSVQWRFFSGNPGTAPGTSAAAPVNAYLQFQVPAGRLDLFREPTLLLKPGIPVGSGLSSSGATVTGVYPSAQLAIAGLTDDKQYIGIVLGTVPMAFTGNIPIDGFAMGSPTAATTGTIPAGYVYYATVVNGMTYRMQYQDTGGNWQTYDEKYVNVFGAFNYDKPNYSTPPSAASPNYHVNLSFNRNSTGTGAVNNVGNEMSVVSIDPRSSRFGMIYAGPGGPRGARPGLFPIMRGTTNANTYTVGWAGGNAASQFAMMTCRPDEYQGLLLSTYDGYTNGYGRNSGPSAGGWGPAGATGDPRDGPGTKAVLRPGLLAQNTPDAGTASSATRYNGDTEAAAADPTQIFADADNVVRGGMGAFVPSDGVMPAKLPTSGSPSGQPLKTANTYLLSGDSSGRYATPIAAENAGRPLVLNRPFRSVAELSYVFSGTPWRNLDASRSESGAGALLDVFCTNDTDDNRGLVAGKLNLNTRQNPVLKAVLTGAYKDELAATTSLLTATEADALANALVRRTTSAATAEGPLANLSDLAGRWNSSVAVGSFIDGRKSFVGFSSDTANNRDDLSTTLTNDADKRVQRFREASIRALAGTGQTRVWNLLIDLVAQSGRYPQNANSLNQFAVEGEQRYWLHVAIDRYTGEVIDRQLEIVKE